MNIVKHIPNTITSLNLLSGVLGVICAFEGKLDFAFYLMIAASAFDFMDGFVARLLNAQSPIGKELDSLSDLVSFGLLPSIMLFSVMKASGQPTLLSLVPLVIVVFSALRLAMFNVSEDQTENFIGLPTPACAMIVGSFVYYITNVPDSFLKVWANTAAFIPVGSVALSLLLVCKMPMFSMKIKKGVSKDNPIQRLRFIFIGVFFICSLLVLLFGLNWSMIIFMVFLIYIIINFVNMLTTKK